MINDCSPHQVRFAEMRALSSATMSLQAAAQNHALVDRGMRRFARTQAQRAFHSWVSFVTNRALTQHTQVLAAQHASVQAAKRALGSLGVKPPTDDQPESSSAPEEELPVNSQLSHGAAATSSAHVAACAPAARTQPPSSRTGSALAPSPRGASCSTAGSTAGTTAGMSEDAVRWMAAAATAAAALGDVVAQFGRYTGGDTARSSSDPDATPAPLSATQRAQFDRTCEREMPEWLRAAADAASLISDAAERLQYGSSHPASHPASRSGSRPSSRCAAEPTSTPKGRIAIINERSSWFGSSLSVSPVASGDKIFYMCEHLMKACDKMGNRCVLGGANIACGFLQRVPGLSGELSGEAAAGSDAPAEGGSGAAGRTAGTFAALDASDATDAGASGQQHASWADLGDGTYLLRWAADAPGVFDVFVKIDGLHVLGSPSRLVLAPPPPPPTRRRLSSNLTSVVDSPSGTKGSAETASKVGGTDS